MWPDRRLIDLFKTEFPIVLAPMAGVMDAELVIAAAQGGALGSLPCAMISAEKAREQVGLIRQRVKAPVNMNFFCHAPVELTAEAEALLQPVKDRRDEEHLQKPGQAPLSVIHGVTLLKA